MESIIDRAHSALTPETLLRLSAQMQETLTATERGLECAMPVSITGLAMVAASEQNAGELLRALRGGEFPHAGAEELSPVASDPGATNQLAQSGEGLLGRIFGNRLDGIVDAVAGQSGVKRASATKLLGLSAPIVLDAVAKQAQSETMNAEGLSRFLDDQSSAASGNLPIPVSRALADAQQDPTGRGPAPRASEPRQEWRPGERRGFADQFRQRAGGALGSARQGVEGAIADVGQRAENVGNRSAGGGEWRDMGSAARHGASAEARRHARRPSSAIIMWALVALVLLGLAAILLFRAGRSDVETPLPQGKVQGLQGPVTPSPASRSVPATGRIHTLPDSPRSVVPRVW